MSDPDITPRDRQLLASTIVVLAFVGIAATATVMIWLIPEDSDQVFSAVVPLFGTWVGTVLAFYFARQNFESASRSMQGLVDRLSPEEQLRSTPVRDVMIKASEIVAIRLKPTETEADIPFASIEGALSPKVTRVPILNADGAVRYVLHQSLIYKVKAAQAPGATPTLKDMLADDALRKLAEALAFVKTDASLADAKRAMDAVSGCQDVFVTQNGKREEPVLGWLDNARMAKSESA
jgi:hypothetical protein